MTNMPEAKLAREAELCYATVAMVTDFDCWHPDHDAVTVQDIIKVLTLTPTPREAKLLVARLARDFRASTRIVRLVRNRGSTRPDHRARGRDPELIRSSMPWPAGSRALNHCVLLRRCRASPSALLRDE